MVKRNNDNTEAKTVNSGFFAIFDKLFEECEDASAELENKQAEEPEADEDNDTDLACFHYCTSSDNMIRGMTAFVIQNELFALLEDDDIIQVIRAAILEEVSSKFIASLTPAASKDGDEDATGN